jgi:hypothetical protein
MNWIAKLSVPEGDLRWVYQLEAQTAGDLLDRIANEFDLEHVLDLSVEITKVRA